MKSKYDILVNILDSLKEEAPEKAKTYHDKSEDGLNHARSLALIHLFLKSKFGLMTFDERVGYVTDGKGDGGIDAYYFNHNQKIFYIIQSKFRANQRNFEDKFISADELSSIDLKRIESGEEYSENGEAYSGKIKELQRKIGEITDLIRWEYKVIILANVKNLADQSIKRLVGGYKYEIFNHLRIYKEVLLPICSGQYFDAENIALEIETTESQKTEISQTIKTSTGEYQVRLLFIPAIELAKNVVQYKNSLMKYNPRNFLSFRTNKVNNEIKKSIIERTDNMFALLNNGITFIARTDSFTDRTGRKGIGRLTISNPQIINGGQTAYALAVIYEDVETRNHLENKSVLAKIITPTDIKSEISDELIEMVSYANNKQSKIVEADQRSNSAKLIKLQEYFFEYHNLLFERKRGEFYEGLSQKYLEKSAMIDRVDLLKSAVAYKGFPSRSRTSQDVLFEEEKFDEIIDGLTTEQLALSFLLRNKLKETKELKSKSPFGIIAAYGVCVNPSRLNPENLDVVSSNLASMKDSWDSFEKWAAIQTRNDKYISNERLIDNYYKGSTIDTDIQIYFKMNPFDITYTVT